MVVHASLLNTQHCKVRVKGKVKLSKEWSSAPVHLDVVAIEKGAFGSPSTKVTNFTLSYLPNPSVTAGYDTRSIF